MAGVDATASKRGSENRLNVFNTGRMKAGGNSSQNAGLQRQNLLLLCIERSVLSSVVNFQIIATFLGSIISLKQLAVVVKGKVRDDQGCNCSAYLDALQLWLFPQSEESEPNNFIWQLDSAPPH
ncbi:UNVERIFIED_CONTAM: hypothetical protein NCL1_14171 [Trichonephila clavipes]